MEMLQTFEPTRKAALSRLAAFLPRAGAAYEQDRNYDHGPDRRVNVSVLSPYIRFRLITEEEVCAAVLDKHSPHAAEKYLQEVLWRSYWKGWLQLRPEAWRRYLDGLAAAKREVEANAGLRRALRDATSGSIGIAGFDDWAQELVDTGYLHNHARMWFASIWIFTLKLPWELGAEFFMQHLADADPASNTLSWRWVAGLQTQGKTYAATTDNIHKYTGGRFQPRGLVRTAEALKEAPMPGPRGLLDLPSRTTGPGALLLTEDDYGVETLPVAWKDISGIAIACITQDRVQEPLGEAANAFAVGAAQDTLSRAAVLAPQAHMLPEPLQRITVDDLLPWLQRIKAERLFVPEPTVGPAADAVAKLAVGLKARGIELVLFRRRFDAMVWPHATHGFFRFKSEIPAFLASMKVSSS